MVRKHPKSSCIQTLICCSFELAFLRKDQQTNQLYPIDCGVCAAWKLVTGMGGNSSSWCDKDDMYRISFPFWMFHGFHGIYKQPFIVEVVWSCTTSNTYTVAIHWTFCTCDDLHSAFVPLLQRCVTAWMCLGPASAVATLKKCIAKVYIQMNSHFFAFFWLMTMVDTDSQCCTCCVSWETRMKYVYIIYGSSWICATSKGVWISQSRYDDVWYRICSL